LRRARHRCEGAAVLVLSSLALKGVLEKLRSEFERAAGPLDLRFDATQAILARLAQGERADLLVVAEEAMEALRKEKRIAESCVLGSSGVGVAVRAGAPKPDIGSVDALIHALVNASSVAHSKVGASGLYFSEILRKLCGCRYRYCRPAAGAAAEADLGLRRDRRGRSRSEGRRCAHGSAAIQRFPPGDARRRDDARLAGFSPA
jgi:hypothetical protein